MFNKDVKRKKEESEKTLYCLSSKFQQKKVSRKRRFYDYCFVHRAERKSESRTMLACRKKSLKLPSSARSVFYFSKQNLIKLHRTTISELYVNANICRQFTTLWRRCDWPKRKTIFRTLVGVERGGLPGNRRSSLTKSILFYGKTGKCASMMERNGAPRVNLSRLREAC